MGQIRAKAGETIRLTKGPLQGREFTFTEEQLKDPSAGFFAEGTFERVTAGAQTVAPQGVIQSSTVAQTGGAGVRALGVSSSTGQVQPFVFGSGHGEKFTTLLDPLGQPQTVLDRNLDQLLKLGFKRPESVVKESGIVKQAGAPDLMLTPSGTLGPITSRTSGDDIVDTATKADATSTTVPQDTGVSTSDRARAQGIQDVKNELTGGAKIPVAPGTADLRKKLREEEGVVDYEMDLADLREEAASLKQELRVFKATAGQRVTESARAGILSEAERNLSFRLESLAIQESALVARVNSKNAYIDQVIQDQRADYQLATDAWNREYALNSKAVDIYNQQIDDIQKQALTTITTLNNLYKDAGVSWGDMSDDVKTSFETAALKLGLPKDTFAQVYQNTSSVDKTLSTKIHDDGTATVVTQDANGELKIMKLGRGAPTTPTGTPPSRTPTPPSRTPTPVPQLTEDGFEIPVLDPKQRVIAMQLQDDYRAEASTFRTQTEAYGRVTASASDPSAAGDLSLIFAYMKMLDPGSVVREGEFATAQNSGSIPQQLVAIYNKVRTGKRLSDSQRNDFINRAGTIYQQATKQHQNLIKEYGRRAQIQGLPTNAIVFSTEAKVATPTSTEQGKQFIPLLGTTVQLPVSGSKSDPLGIR